MSLLFVGQMVYDRKEEFTFKDGGKIYIQYKGKTFDQIDASTPLNDTGAQMLTNESEQYPPLLFIVPGLTSTGEVSYVKSIVTEAEMNGYEVVVINYRGLCGMELATPQLYNSCATEDIKEPMEHVYKKYCKA